MSMSACSKRRGPRRSFNLPVAAELASPASSKFDGAQRRAVGASTSDSMKRLVKESLSLR